MKAFVAIVASLVAVGSADAQSNLTPSGRNPSGSMYIQPKVGTLPNATDYDVPRRPWTGKRKPRPTTPAAPAPSTASPDDAPKG